MRGGIIVVVLCIGAPAWAQLREEPGAPDLDIAAERSDHLEADVTAVAVEEGSDRSLAVGGSASIDREFDYGGAFAAGAEAWTTMATSGNVHSTRYDVAFRAHGEDVFPIALRHSLEWDVEPGYASRLDLRGARYQRVGVGVDFALGTIVLPNRVAISGFLGKQDMSFTRQQIDGVTFDTTDVVTRAGLATVAWPRGAVDVFAVDFHVHDGAHSGAVFTIWPGSVSKDIGDDLTLDVAWGWGRAANACLDTREGDMYVACGATLELDNAPKLGTSVGYVTLRSTDASVTLARDVYFTADSLVAIENTVRGGLAHQWPRHEVELGAFGATSLVWLDQSHSRTDLVGGARGRWTYDLGHRFDVSVSAEIARTFHARLDDVLSPRVAHRAEVSVTRHWGD